MSKIHAVLLVPPKGDGDPHGLLVEGPCGARPPTAYIPNRGWKWREGPCAEEFPIRRGLVLAWEGKPVPEGLERSVRAAKSRAWVEYLVGCALGRLADDVDGLSDPDLPGILVLLDAEGREVKT